MKLSDLLFEAVQQLRPAPIVIKIGTHRRPSGNINDPTYYNEVYMSENTFDRLITKVMPLDEFDYDAIVHTLAVIDDDVDNTAIVLLDDGRIAYEDTIGEQHASTTPIDMQQFWAILHRYVRPPKTSTEIIQPGKLKRIK